MTRKKKISLGIAAFVVLAGISFFFIGKSIITSPYNGTDSRWVFLPQNSTKEALSDSLTNALGERVSKRVILIYNYIANDSTPIGGAYKIEPGTSAFSIARRIANRQQTPVRVTFNNIRTLQQLADRIANQMDFTAEDFIAACNSVLPNYGFKNSQQYPAAFLPDTYEFYWTTSAENTVERLLKVRNNFWNDTRRAKAASLGLTPVEVASIAAIVEEETANRAERPTVARLYINRLKKGMKLQADPTVKFAVGDFSLRRILKKHLQTESPYNTYLHSGLTPGPIRIPTAQTLNDVLDAPQHSYLYMCAKEDFSGQHNFAVDYATHLANARRYQKALNARGIK